MQNLFRDCISFPPPPPLAANNWDLNIDKTWDWWCWDDDSIAILSSTWKKHQLRFYQGQECQGPQQIHKKTVLQTCVLVLLWRTTSLSLMLVNAQGPLCQISLTLPRILLHFFKRLPFKIHNEIQWLTNKIFQTHQKSASDTNANTNLRSSLFAHKTFIDKRQEFGVLR